MPFASAFFLKGGSMLRIILILFLFLPLSFMVSGQETLSMSTYYPSPKGIYNQVEVSRGVVFKPVDRAGISDPDEGELVLDTDGNFYYYTAAEGWQKVILQSQLDDLKADLEAQIEESGGGGGLECTETPINAYNPAPFTNCTELCEDQGAVCTECVFWRQSDLDPGPTLYSYGCSRTFSIYTPHAGSHLGYICKCCK